MTSRSRGAALWVGLNMHKASVKWSKTKIRSLIDARSFNLADFLTQLEKSGLQPSMQVQLPGTCIYSPSGRGSAHIVITVGEWVEQVAINHSFSPQGLVRATAFWDGAEPLLHNSALATRCVVPMMWLQKHKKGFELGLEEQIRVIEALVKAVREEDARTGNKTPITYRNFDHPDDVECLCKGCFKRIRNRRAILYVQIGAYCPGCFVDTHQQYLHFANMIDRRFI